MSHEAIKVYMTGQGLLTAAGLSISENWEALSTNTSYLKKIESVDLSEWPCCLGGELHGFDARKHLPDKKLLKLISPQDTYGLFAAYQAIDDAQLLAYRDTLSDASEFNDRTGIYVASPGNKYTQQYDFLPLLSKTQGNMQAFGAELFNEVHPMWLLRILPNNVLAYTGIHSGFKGPNHNIANHAVGGMQALIEAFHAIRRGQIDRAVVVAYDVGIDPQALFYYDKLGLLSPTGIQPFSQAQHGTVLANGAAAVVLEGHHSVMQRGAHRYAEVLYGASQTEGAGLFGIDKTATHLTKLMSDVLHHADCDPKDLGFILAHGNGTQASDDSEALAITRLLDKKQEVPISALKWSMGHTLVASGLVDTLLATKALSSQTLPGIATLKQPSEASKKLNLQREMGTIAEHTALIINRGFASMNACLAIRACE